MAPRLRLAAPIGRRRPMLTRSQMLQPVGRWTAGAKACLVEAIAIGLVGEAEALKAHAISPDELAGWRAGLRRGGVPDLRLRALQSRPERLASTLNEAAARAA